MARPRTVPAYVASLSPDARRAFRPLRAAVRAAAPGGVEGISYGIPVLRIEGQGVVWYAAWKHHVSLYPLPAALRPDARRLGLETSKGTLRIPGDRPLPRALVRRLVRVRVTAVRAALAHRA